MSGEEGDKVMLVNNMSTYSHTLFLLDKVVFSCPRGYTLTGDKETRCMASNQWSVKVSHIQLHPEVNICETSTSSKLE